MISRYESEYSQRVKSIRNGNSPDKCIRLGFLLISLTHRESFKSKMITLERGLCNYTDVAHITMTAFRMGGYRGGKVFAFLLEWYNVTLRTLWRLKGVC